MKILHVIPSLATCRGGATKAAIDMVKALRGEGIDAEIATTNDNGASELDIPLNQLINYEGVPVRFFRRLLPKGSSALASAIREFAYSSEFKNWLKTDITDYDVVHVHALFSFTSSYSMRLARKRGVPYIAHPIGSLDHWSLKQSALRKKLFLTLIDKKNLLAADRVHFTAESEHQQALTTAPGLRPVVIPLGLELPKLIPDAELLLRKSHNLPDGQPIIVYLGRLHQKKGLELLLSAFASCHDLPGKLLIAGTGDEQYTTSLAETIALLQLEKRTAFLGYTSGYEKELLLQGADLFVLTSHSENFGIAVLEASASGTAVLVSEGVALSNQVATHKLGAVCRTNVESIADKLVTLLQQPRSLSEMGQRGRDFVEQHHNWSNLARELIKTYRIITAA